MLKKLTTSCFFVRAGIPSAKPVDAREKEGEDGQGKGKKKKKNKKKDDKSQGTGIMVDDLMSALEESSTVARRKTPLNQTAPRRLRNAQRAKMEVAEAAQFKSVFGMSAFQSNPMDSIAQHIKNTVALSQI